MRALLDRMIRTFSICLKPIALSALLNVCVCSELNKAAAVGTAAAFELSSAADQRKALDCNMIGQLLLFYHFRCHRSPLPTHTHLHRHTHTLVNVRIDGEDEFTLF